MRVSRARKMLFAVPLMAAAAAWVLPSIRAEGATNDGLDGAAAVEAAAVVEPQAIDDGLAILDEEFLEVDAGSIEVDPFDAMLVSNCTYYNNANHTQIVGQFGYDCCNNRVAWGKKTSFYECGGCFPCIPPPR